MYFCFKIINTHLEKNRKYFLNLVKVDSSFMIELTYIPYSVTREFPSPAIAVASGRHCLVRNPNGPHSRVPLMRLLLHNTLPSCSACMHSLVNVDSSSCVRMNGRLRTGEGGGGDRTGRK